MRTTANAWDIHLLIRQEVAKQLLDELESLDASDRFTVKALRNELELAVIDCEEEQGHAGSRDGSREGSSEEASDA